MKKLLTLLCTMLVLVLLAAAPALALDDEAALISAPEPALPDWSQWAADYMAAHPDEVAALVAAAPKYWADEGFASQQDMLDAYGMTEEEYLIGWVLWDGLYPLYMAELEAAQQAQLLAARVELGGPAEGIGVMADGKYIAFPDAQPQLVSGRTMIPLRALAEALGAQVSYAAEGQRVLIDRNGAQISFAVGEGSFTLSENGQTSSVSMDCASYINASRTYVPVRFFAQAFGYDVLWDADYRTAVLLDKEKLIAAANAQFTRVNKALAAANAPLDKKYRLDYELAAIFTSFSTLDGDTVSRATADITYIVDGLSMQVTGEVDLRQLLKLLLNENDPYLTEADRQYIDSLSHITLELIFNEDEGMMYIKCPALMPQIDAQAPTDAWLMIDYNELYAEAFNGLTLEQLAQQSTSMGGLLYLFTMSEANSGWGNPIEFISVLEEGTAQAAVLIGDATFTRQGAAYVRSFDRDEYQQLVYGTLPDSESGYDFQRCDLELRLHDNGQISGSCNIRVNGSYIFGLGSDMQLSGKFTQSGAESDMELELHVENAWKLNLTATTSQSATTQTPAAAPPTGSTIIDLNELY